MEVSSFEGDDDIDEDEVKNDGMQPWQVQLREYATSPAPSEAVEDTEQGMLPKKMQTLKKVADDKGFVADSEEDEDQDAENSGEDSSWSEDDDEGRRETQKARPHSSRRKRGGDIAAHGILLQRFDENIIEEISNDDVSTASLPPWSVPYRQQYTQTNAHGTYLSGMPKVAYLGSSLRKRGKFFNAALLHPNQHLSRRRAKCACASDDSRGTSGRDFLLWKFTPQ